MTHTIKKKLYIFALAAVLASQQAMSGAIITDTVVARDGREWAQIDLFYRITWDEIDNLCAGGFCAIGSSLNGWSLDGWLWATMEDVAGLFDAYHGLGNEPGIYYERDSQWAPEFFADFRATSISPATNDGDIRGWVSTAYPGSPGYAYSALLVDRADGVVFDDVANTSLGGGSPKTNTANGVWLVRSVPTVSSLLLVILALSSLVASVRFRHRMAPISA